MKNKTLKELADRLYQIEFEKKRLDEEYDLIIYELWDRVPTLKNEELFQPIKRRSEDERKEIK